MNNFSITIKKRADKFLDYQKKQMALVSYLSGLPVENIKQLIEEFPDTPYIFEFK